MPIIPVKFCYLNRFRISLPLKASTIIKQSMRVEKHWVWVIFFSVWDNSRKNYGHAFLLLGYTIAKITVHAPGQHMWLSPGPWPYSECSKTVEVKGQKTLSARDHHWRILRKKDYRELCNVKARLLNMTDHTLFSLRLIQTDGLMIKTSFSDLGYMGLNPALDLQGAELSANPLQFYVTLSLSLHWQLIFCMQDCHCSSWISRPDKIYQNSSR